MEKITSTAGIDFTSSNGPLRSAVTPVARWLLVLVAFVSGIPAFGQSAGPTVIVSRAEQSTLIEEVPLTGSVISPRIARLSTEVSGIIEALEIELGDQVQFGDEILRLQASDFADLIRDKAPDFLPGILTAASPMFTD